MHAKLIRDMDKLDIIYLLGVKGDYDYKSDEDKFKVFKGKISLCVGFLFHSLMLKTFTI